MSSLNNYRPPNAHYAARQNGGPTGYHQHRQQQQQQAPPKGYIPGIGRGASGFTTRSDIGPMAASSSAPPPSGAPSGAPLNIAGNDISKEKVEIGATDLAMHLSGSGSRSSELREAKLRMKRMQQQATTTTTTIAPSSTNLKTAPIGYIPGLGRGAGIKSFDDTSGGNDEGPKGSMGGGAGGRDSGGGGGNNSGTYDQFSGYTTDRLFGNDTPYDDDDEEADRIYAAVDERMNNSHHQKKKRNVAPTAATANQDGDNGRPLTTTTTTTTTTTIGDQFRELKEQLATVSEDQWMSIPDVGDYSLRHKRKRNNAYDVFTPLTDSLLEGRLNLTKDATASNKNAAISKITAVEDGFVTSINPHSSTGYRSVVSNMSGLAEARGTVLGMSLDKWSDTLSSSSAKLANGGGGAAAAAATGNSTTGTTTAGDGSATIVGGHASTVDPQGYLTSLSSIKIASAAEIGDINRARLLLKSVRDTNPKHGPGWIAAARVEEAAGKMLAARKIIQDACESCPDNEDVWIEAARLHPPDVAKTILATAVRHVSTSIKIFLKAADLESNDASKKAVLRKGIECIPTSSTLWKAAIELEKDPNDAKVLLSVAVERIPQSVDMWLALAKLETYDAARRVLNRARKHLPAERSIWIAAAKLEESQNRGRESIDKLIEKAVKSLSKHDAVVTRAQWLKEAESAEMAGAALTSGAIIKHTLGLGVDAEDRLRTWPSDASSALSNGAVVTCRAILAHSLAAFPSKRSLWMQAVELEQKHGTRQSLDEVLAAASERLPTVEIFWLIRAKEQWVHGNLDRARQVLMEAFNANPNSEAVWLAAAKLEWETNEIHRARLLLQRARERAGTQRVYMKSALLERKSQQFSVALELLQEGIAKYPQFDKLYMMGGQINADDLKNIDQARDFYSKGLKSCPTSVVLWVLASNLEERVAKAQLGDIGGAYTKARSLLELSRLKNPKNPRLWVEAIRLERRATNDKMANTLMAKALQECPSSGLLLAENITTAPRVEQKSKSADAIKRCPDDPLVIAAVASLFASERKTQKARKWFDRAVVLDPDNGDSWAKSYVFELENGTEEQQQAVKDRCIREDPKHGELWPSVAKDMSNLHKKAGEILDLTAQKMRSENK